MFEAFAEFLHEGMREQRDEGDGRILLGDNTGGGAVMLGPIRLQFIRVWISSSVCTYINIFDYT